MTRSPAEAGYGPLGNYLARQADAGQHQVVLPFVRIEVAILGHPLPRTARARGNWWGNDGTEYHAWYGWLRAGWRVVAVSLAEETVTFARPDDG